MLKILFVSALFMSSAYGAERFIVAPVAEARPEFAPEVLVVVTDESRFAVTVPPRWSATYDTGARELIFRNGQLDGKLTIRFRESAVKERDAKEYWAKLKSSFESPEALGEPVLMAFSQRAVAYDLTWLHASGLKRAARCALVEVRGTEIEFELTTSAPDFQAQLATMMHVMAKMRVAAADERVEIPFRGVE